MLCVAIEASGDRLLAHTLKTLQSTSPDLPLKAPHEHHSKHTWELIGIGGPQSQAAGLDTLIDPQMLAAHGLTEALRVLPATLRAWRLLKKIALQVDAYLLVDAPELNMRLLRWVKTHRDPQHGL